MRMALQQVDEKHPHAREGSLCQGFWGEGAGRHAGARHVTLSATWRGMSCCELLGRACVWKLLQRGRFFNSIYQSPPGGSKQLAACAAAEGDVRACSSARSQLSQAGRWRCMQLQHHWFYECVMCVSDAAALPEAAAGRKHAGQEARAQQRPASPRAPCSAAKLEIRSTRLTPYQTGSRQAVAALLQLPPRLAGWLVKTCDRAPQRSTRGSSDGRQDHRKHANSLT